MNLLKKEINISDLAVFILILCNFIFRQEKLLLRMADVLFLAAMLLRIRNRNWMFTVTYYSLFSVLFAAFAFLSYFWARDGKNCIDALKPLFQITVLSVFFSYYLDSIETSKRVLRYFLVASLFLLLVLVIRTPRAEWIADMQEMKNTSTSSFRIGRSIGFHPNALGMLCAFCFLLWLYYLTDNTSAKKGLGIVALLLMLVPIVFSKSRKAILTIVIAPTLYLLLYRQRGRKIWIAVPLLFLAAWGVLWSTINIPFLYTMVGFRLIRLTGFLGGAATADASVVTRVGMMEVGLELFADHPFFGVGFGNFSSYYYRFFDGIREVYSHNNYIEILADTGIVGFVLYYFVPIGMFVSLIRNWKRNCAVDRKLSAFLVAFLFTRLVMDYGMIVYDDEFVQLLTVTCYGAFLGLRKKELSSPPAVKDTQ